MFTTSAETVDTSSQTLLNVNMSNVTKPSAANYMMWSLQVHAFLDTQFWKMLMWFFIIIIILTEKVINKIV